MKDFLITIRNIINRFFYLAILKPIFFHIEPEAIHNIMIKAGSFLGSNFFTQKLVALLFSYSNANLEQNILGIQFRNPVGLGAGFDKNAQLTKILPFLGFGFAEVGSITGKPCKGNPRPRLWRLKKSKALVVYYGLNNKGCEEISEKLKSQSFQIPIGISVAKTNCKETVETQAGIDDYIKAYKKFINIGSYSTINISCPNTFGGQNFTDAKKLDKLLARIDEIATEKPIFLKMSCDLTKTEVDDIIEVSQRHHIDGFICTNLTKNRNNKKILDSHVPENGGISGKVVEELSNKLISYMYRRTNGKYIIIGSGGVFSAEDAYKKIRLGASLIQLITGMIFEGPQLISEINQGLVKLLKRDGFDNIQQAVGVDSR